MLGPPRNRVNFSSAVCAALVFDWRRVKRCGDFGGGVISTLPAGAGHAGDQFCSFVMEAAMAKGFELRCGAAKTARVWLQGKGGDLKPGQGMVLLPVKDGGSDGLPAAYLAPLRRELIDDNRRHVNVVVCESDYRALKGGISHLVPGVQ